MSIRNLDIGVLRSFLLISEGRTFAEAADLVGRSPSAVSLQIQRLEEVVGAPVLRRSSREVTLTLAGERFLGHARRLVAANDAAVLSFGHGAATRMLRIGVTQDFAESALPAVLRRFSLEHPNAQLSLRVDKSAAIIAALHAGEIDVAVAIRRGDALERFSLAELPMIWIGRDGGVPGALPVVPLVLFDPPCTFRSAAVEALAARGRDHRVAVTSPSLSGLRSAVEAGLGLTARTRLLLSSGLADVGERLGLPVLPAVGFALLVPGGGGGAWAALDDFVELCRREFRSP